MALLIRLVASNVFENCRSASGSPSSLEGHRRIVAQLVSDKFGRPHTAMSPVRFDLLETVAHTDVILSIKLKCFTESSQRRQHHNIHEVCPLPFLSRLYPPFSHYPIRMVKDATQQPPWCLPLRVLGHTFVGEQFLAKASLSTHHTGHRLCFPACHVGDTVYQTLRLATLSPPGLTTVASSRAWRTWTKAVYC